MLYIVRDENSVIYGIYRRVLEGNYRERQLSIYIYIGCISRARESRALILVEFIYIYIALAALHVTKPSLGS